MAASHRTITINRPVESVFAFVADGENSPRWRSGVMDIERVSGTGLGATYRQGVRGPMGRRISADFTYTVFEPNRLLEFQTITGPVRPRGRYEFDSVGEGTRLTFSLEAELAGLKKLLMESRVAKTMVSEVAALDKLKEVLES